MEPEVQQRKGWAGRLLVGALVVAAVAALAVQGWLEQKAQRMVASGRPAPSFRVARLEGGTLGLEDLKGKVVMLDFWATWCPPCREEMPALVTLAREYQDKGLVFLAVNADFESPEDVTGWAQMTVPGLLPYVAFADSEMLSAYNITSLPTLYFVDRKGQLLESTSGALTEPQLRRMVQAALASE
ncbi:MAG: TlpA family protein disulfide reductase [Myxococcaceae bacterium]|nr:TlpA family protein disulfide reductase [Myxococcaceae bacterium]MCI0674006.1 TlpA family protein disulfide reductase [Myxococcaceae bacterium]